MAAAIQREARTQAAPFVGNPTFDAARCEWKAKEADARRVLNHISKMRAKTAAGIYAKATLVATRRGYMTAPAFMHSLATDLVSNPTLRRSLWPAEAP